MALADASLYHAARLLYRSEVAHSAEMKSALADRASSMAYRSGSVTKVMDAAGRLGVDLRGRDVLDLGCNDGALTVEYAAFEPKRIVGVDIDAGAVARAQRLRPHPLIEFRVTSTSRLNVETESIDRILCYDVFEHVSRPADVLAECRRVLRPGGKMLIGTWGWYHPFAPHLWATMPVPWAHLLVSERALIRACRRVYEAGWYTPTFHDLNPDGSRRDDKYRDEAIPTDYLNKYLVRDFERVFRECGMRAEVHLQPFGSLPWMKPLLRVPLVRELVHGYLWAVLEKPAAPPRG